jgi:tRNA(Ile2)-agmatinylcytidine synthase
MTVIGLDDTDSRERGCCTTYVATLVAEAVADAGGTVDRRLLVRLNPAVEHKTRGNAALALHVDLPPDRALALASETVAEWAVVDDPNTAPGVVVARGDANDPTAVPDAVSTFTRGAVRGHHALADALELCDRVGYAHAGWAGGRGRIGALAAVGAWRAFDEWTYERLSYRAFDRCGTPREVDVDSVFAAAESGYPRAWDTVDRETGEAVCVPNAPGPVLHGIRGDDPAVVREVADRIDAEPVDRAATFATNQGTDVHVQPGRLPSVREGRSYRLDGAVATDPETRRGGHVAFALREPTGTDAGSTVTCLAFAPTGRFRDRVRALRPGDRVTVVGEYGVQGGDRSTDAAGATDGTASDSPARPLEAPAASTDATAPTAGDRLPGAVKLEKFAVRDLVRTEPAVPRCPDCGRSMESAGRGQGYRCRDCGTSTPGKVDRSIDRELAPGWYEVPPSARRHVAKPLVRGGFDAATHPER